MTDKIKQNAVLAEQLLDNPILKRVLDGLQDSVVSQLTHTDHESPEHRQELCITLKVIHNIRNTIQDEINTLAIAAKR